MSPSAPSSRPGGPGQTDWYHATSVGAVEAIVEQGFRVWVEHLTWCDDTWVRWPSDGNLGVGIYVTEAWREALVFGNVLLRLELRPGTRLVDLSPAPEQEVLRYLTREFGRAVLELHPRAVLPRNKHLTDRELIEVARHHYREAWSRDVTTFRFSRKQQRQVHHARLIHSLRSEFLRRGFHGLGDPASDNGCVVYVAEQILLDDIVLQATRSDLDTMESDPTMSLEDLMKRFESRPGHARVRELSEQVRAQRRT